MPVRPLRKRCTSKSRELLRQEQDLHADEYAGVIEVLTGELEACRRALAEADFLEPDPDLA